MTEEKDCSKHGLTLFSIYKAGSPRCRKCLYESVKARRKQLKVIAVEYKGGKCQLCGYNKCISALEFHHLVSTEKDFSISGGGKTRSLVKIKSELDKCILLCANCHREEHENQIKI